MTTIAERATPEKLRGFAVGVLRGIGMPDEDADACAEALVWAELRGAWRHGVSGRLPALVGRARSGSVNVTPGWKTLQDDPSFTLVDADAAWGQVAGTHGMRIAVTKARSTGAAVTIVRNSEVTAALGWYPTVAVRERMIGMAINNSYPLMAAWGGATRAIGNQAFAIGAPADRHGYLLFDSTVAAMSSNAIEGLKERGEDLPPGTALDKEGRPTIDPEEALAGVILPMGGHRGYGLALMWEVLTGVLSGGAAPVAEPGKPMGISLFLLAIDPVRSMPYEQFTARTDALIERMQRSTPAEAGRPVRVPGERGRQLEIEYGRDGVPVPRERAEKLRRLGAEVGIAW